MYRLQDKITKKYTIFVMKYLYKILKFTPSELPRKVKKVSFLPIHKASSHRSVQKNLGSKCPALSGGKRAVIPLPALSNPDIRQIRRSEVDSSVFYLLGTTEVGKQRVRCVTEGCVRHFVREQHPGTGMVDTGLQEAPRAHRNISTAGKTQQVELRGECYTDVVTRSGAWLTSFLFESSPLAAFMSFRKFSTVFFMFFNSPGCGVARL